jgi:hypothetical protein
MRPLLLLLVIAACASSKPAEGPAARWEIDKEDNLAVPVCPRCGAPVLRDETKCAGCGAACHVEGKTVECPECRGGETTTPCEACEGTGKCAICDGTGTFEGKTCPECEGKRTCPDCHGKEHGGKHACENCGGTGRIELE